MRWLTYRHLGADAIGVLGDGDVIHGLAPGRTMLELLSSEADLVGAGARALERPHHTVALDAVTVLAPLQPPSIRDFASFVQHMRNCAAGAGLELNQRYDEVPVFYFSNPAAVIGPSDDVAVFPGSDRFDYELEVCAVIGRRGRDIDPRDAEAHIAGYSILCDWSARDLQVDEMSMGLGTAKGKDGATTLGPYLVTPDDLEPCRSGNGFALSMTASVNGEVISEGRWDSIDWSFADMIAYASRGTELRPGDVIGSGTVPTGCLFEHSVLDPRGFRGWLQLGDQVELAVEGLGRLSQRVVAGSLPKPLSQLAPSA